MLLALGVAASLGIVYYKARDLTWATAKNGKAYRVRRDASPEVRAQSAERLAELEAKFRDFLDRAVALFPTDERIVTLRRRWDGTFGEVSGPSDGAAYSLDKQSVFLCLRNTSGDMESLNRTIYVMMHEAAHVATECCYGHPPEFWANFRWLLEVAERTGLYTYDAMTDGATYCGTSLGDSLLQCVHRKTCPSVLH